MALKVRRYDLRGVYRGQKVTYSAASPTAFSAASTTAPFATITASATKTIRLQRVVVTATVATAAVYGTVALRKISAAPTGGTAVTLTQVPFISTSSAGSAALCQYYTSAPTAGTLVGTVASQMAFLPLTGTAALGVPTFTFDFANESEMETPTLVAGTTQGFELGFGVSVANAPSITVTFIWTEE